MNSRIQCPFCLERFSIQIHREDGEWQDLVYDCEICCHPIDIKASWDEDLDRFQLTIERSSGFD